MHFIKRMTRKQAIILGCAVAATAALLILFTSQTIRQSAQVHEDSPEISNNQLQTELSEVEEAPVTEQPSPDVKARLVHSRTPPTFLRLHGPSAFETSVAVSKHYYGPGVDVAYVAQRSAYPDAIVAGTLPLNGPILYTDVTSMPATVAAELQRLQPKKVIIVGGEGVVSDAVRAQIRSRIPSSSPVERFAGPNRIATAITASLMSYPQGANVVYIANSTAYPDAIVAGQQQVSGPLLYTGATISNEVIAEISRLRPQKVVVMGGNTIVSDAVMQTIRSRTAVNVERVSGADRYATAASLSKSLYPNGAKTVFIAEGGAYADSILLNAAPTNGPTLYVGATSIPESTMAELYRLSPDQIIAIGGESRVSQKVSQQLQQVANGAQVSKRVKAGVSYFLVTHPDDEIAGWSYLKDSEYPVFILLTQGEASGHCTANGGKGSNQCKQRRVASWHNFLDNYYAVSDKGIQPGGFRLHVGSNSARLVFDFGDGNLTQDEVTQAITAARAVDFGSRPENYIASASFWNQERDPACSASQNAHLCGHYDHPDHRYTSLAVTALADFPNRITVHAAHNPAVNAATTTGVPLFEHIMHCTQGTYNRAYSWLRPPCWNSQNSFWRHWQWIREY